MGQYWKPVMEAKDGKRYYVCTHYWDNGYKFMEHSWIGNHVPNVVMHMIYKNPMKVSWVGDYCDKPIGKDGPIGETLWEENANDQMWSLINKSEIPGHMKDDIPEKIEDISDSEVKDFMKKFNDENIVNYNIVNHTKKQYLSMKEYMNAVKDEEWKMHPLPVLTAGPSMDYGGGDYHESCAINWDKVGIWSWDVVSVEEDVPEGYEKVDVEKYTFKELR